MTYSDESELTKLKSRIELQNKLLLEKDEELKQKDKEIEFLKYDTDLEINSLRKVNAQLENENKQLKNVQFYQDQLIESIGSAKQCKDEYSALFTELKDIIGSDIKELQDKFKIN